MAILKSLSPVPAILPDTVMLDLPTISFGVRSNACQGDVPAFGRLLYLIGVVLGVKP